MIVKRAAVVVLVVLSLAPSAQARPISDVPGRAAAACSDYPNQAAAQRAADTADPDGDGIYCESLPCPCLTPGQPDRPERRTCTRPRGVQDVTFSAARYANIRDHFLRALRRGWPRILVINRSGADERRDRLLRGIPTQPRHDRDEYPPAVGRGAGRPALKRGRDPIGWRASVMYVPSRENQSHGSQLGRLLRPWCNGTRFRYVFA